jgi:hypothetical protein
MLHGQTCNESKCLVTVKAPKDRIVFWGVGLTDVGERALRYLNVSLSAFM